MNDVMENQFKKMKQFAIHEELHDYTMRKQTIAKNTGTKRIFVYSISTKVFLPHHKINVREMFIKEEKTCQNKTNNNDGHRLNDQEKVN